MLQDLYFGSSPAMRAVLDDVDAFATSHESLLLTGETGTGKSVLAGLIHKRSGRTGRFVPTSGPELDVLSLPRLVGHCRGSFTGASGDQQGLLLNAHQGTLFLDEVCHASIELQCLLLTVIEHQEVQPIGARRAVPVAVRFITAANRPLDQDGFLPELVARLDTLEIRLPPLRERRHDIPRLAEALLGSIARAHRREQPRLTQCAVQTLKTADWPTNIRGLYKALVRAFLHTPNSSELTADAIVPEMSDTAVQRQFRKHTSPPSADLIERELAICGGDFRLAASRLDYSVNHLRFMLKRGLAAGLSK